MPGLPTDYVPVTREEVADDHPHMLAGHIRALQSEMRAGFDLLGNRIIEELRSIRQMIDGHEYRLLTIEREHLEQHRRHTAHNERLTALEVESLLTQAKKRKKKLP